MSKPAPFKYIRARIESAFSVWRGEAFNRKPFDKEYHRSVVNAQDRVEAWLDQTEADLEHGKQDAARLVEALIALRELYQSKGADEVLDARAKAAKVLGIQD